MSSNGYNLKTCYIMIIYYITLFNVSSGESRFLHHAWAEKYYKDDLYIKDNIYDISAF